MVDDIANNFVDEFGLDQVDSNQGELVNVRRSAHELVSSSRYPLAEYVKITECGKLKKFNEAKTHVEKES